MIFRHCVIHCWAMTMIEEEGMVNGTGLEPNAQQEAAARITVNQLLTLIRHSLGDKWLQAMALMLSGAAFGVHLWDPEPLRLYGAIAFTGLVWVPLVWRK